MMDNTPYVKSYYYPAEQKTKKKSLPNSEVPQRRLAIGQTNHQNQMEVLQSKRVAPYPVPEHYFSPQPVVEKPLIESSYCETMNSYSSNYFMDGRPKINRDEYNANMVNDRCAAAGVAADVVNYSSNVPPQNSYQPYHEMNERQKAAYVDALVTDLTQGLVTPCDTAADDRNKAKIYEMSEYAWRRVDEETAAQYAIPQYHHSTVGKHDEVVKNQDCAYFSQAQLQENELMPRYFAKEYSVPGTKAHKEGEEAYSEYFGIPNDLYLAYCSKPTITYKATPALSTKPPPNYEIRSDGSAAFDIIQQPQSSAIENDTNRFDQTTEENLPYRSRFSPQIKPELTDLQAPANYPLAAHYSSQYSTVGNAFAPVKHMTTVSEYQLEDLNDLASCIDVL